MGVESHNPTDKRLTPTDNSGKGYNRVPSFAKTVSVPAGGQIEFLIAG